MRMSILSGIPNAGPRSSRTGPGRTIEHVLAALQGMEIDNALMEVDGPEIPILDGSSLPFIELLERVGIVEQSIERKYFVLQENPDLQKSLPQNGDAGCSEVMKYRITVMVDYNSDLLGTQHASLYNVREFKSEIAGYHTFVFLQRSWRCCSTS